MIFLNIAKISLLSKNSKTTLSDDKLFWNIAVHIGEKKLIWGQAVVKIL